MTVVLHIRQECVHARSPVAMRRHTRFARSTRDPSFAIYKNKIKIISVSSRSGGPILTVVRVPGLLLLLGALVSFLFRKIYYVYTYYHEIVTGLRSSLDTIKYIFYVIGGTGTRGVTIIYEN